FNGASTIVQDRRHVESFAGVEGFFPSPSVFLYTLPNIAVGEIAIRHGIKGETGLYILQEKDWNLMETIIGASLPKSATAISGWVDCRTENDYEADLKLITTK
ncbi:MAG: 3-oxoacyl-ACP synthase, partial [Bacteroidales bacterium]|nr:3-oxoacyl-ACP synthase [Bacteroidales bacterium]